VGRGLGLEVGTAVGLNVGTAVGAVVVGSKLGRVESLFDGLMLGLMLGLIDGLMSLDLTEGLFDGLMLVPVLIDDGLFDGLVVSDLTEGLLLLLGLELGDGDALSFCINDWLPWDIANLVMTGCQTLFASSASTVIAAANSVSCCVTATHSTVTAAAPKS
jgi:hypothetical protein